MNGPGPAPIVALVGPRDRPVDGVRDYCARLEAAVGKLGARLDLVEMRWDTDGWPRALRRLDAMSRTWRGRSVLAQYTHGMWPWRGFPFGFLGLVRTLGENGVRVTVVLHDPSPFPGARVRDRARRWAQVSVMRRAVRTAHRVVSTVSPERVWWMREQAMDGKVTFIPVGSNLPEPGPGQRAADRRPGRPKRVVVFGVTGGRNIPAEVTAREVEAIAYAVTQVARQVPGLRLEVFGRGSEEAAGRLATAFAGTAVRVSVLGLLPAEAVPRLLGQADALLYVRGHLSTRRTTGVAAIASGLPIVGYEGDETDDPVREAGVVLVPAGDRVGLARALARVLLEEDLWQELSRRNVLAHGRYFSWDVIARRYLELLADD